MINDLLRDRKTIEALRMKIRMDTVLRRLDKSYRLQKKVSAIGVKNSLSLPIADDTFYVIVRYIV